MERREGGLSLTPALTRRCLQELGPHWLLQSPRTHLCRMLWGPRAHSADKKRISAWLGFLQEPPPRSENGAEKVSGSHQARS